MPQNKWRLHPCTDFFFFWKDGIFNNKCETLFWEIEAGA